MKKLIILLFLWFNVLSAQADSPITSTDFCMAYQDHPMVKKAKELSGNLSIEILNFLTSKKKGIDIKLAVINQLGWNFNGKNNTDTYLTFVLSKRGFKSKSEFLEKGKAEDLICWAYLLALDNYFDVNKAAEIADKALTKNKGSFSIALIANVIKAQQAFDTDWCKVFQLTDEVRKNNSLKRDMNDEAIRIIYDYMDLYQSSCNKE